ncbi:uncharacterized protein LTR77_008607 [Saxophila tyrrhenica]|uniref:Uncharacterized protein n=1 Tax=Saxophila tyrrhenica TaxID=1690608 RepID=A0AAV9NZP2_9PEZI|nr:hypothetical protein LTR77_008607 [Saxophila tyrrhenica]
MSYANQQNPNPSQQKRNLQPTASTSNTYSATPSQLTLPSDLPSSALGNPYQQGYNYAPAHQDQSTFAFPQHPSYRPPGIHTQNLSQQQFQQPPAQSPSNSRKRRISELEQPGSSSSNASAYAHPSGLSASTDTDIGLSLQQNQLSSPVVKKGRTNTPWTPAEEQRLKQLRDQGSSWSEIAKQFPTRTEGSVKKHWYKDMHYAEFGDDEVSNFVRLTAGTVHITTLTDNLQSAALLQAIKDYDNNKWKVIGHKVGKPAKACEQFAKDQGWKV